MTKLLPYATIQNTAGDGPGAPGAAPLSLVALMLGNPQASQFTPNGNYPPAPQVGAVAQTINAPLVHDAISRGNVPLNAQPTNFQAAAGTGVGQDSLLAMISRGQVTFNQSNYGQPVSISRDSGPAVQPSAEPIPVATGPGSSVTVAAAPTYLGD